MCSVMAKVSSDMKHVIPEAGKLLLEASDCLSSEILPSLVDELKNLRNQTEAI